MILGQERVQGLDYAYTLQGWLKGVNSTSLDPLQDMGADGKPNSSGILASDVFSYSLNYYAGDYSAINKNVTPFPGSSAYLNNNYRPLYNGNISSMAVNIGTFNNPLLYNYGYDHLNRLSSMDVFTGLNQSTNDWSALRPTNDYKERITYDANGNINTYLIKLRSTNRQFVYGRSKLSL